MELEYSRNGSLGLVEAQQSSTIGRREAGQRRQDRTEVSIRHEVEELDSFDDCISRARESDADKEQRRSMSSKGLTRELPGEDGCPETTVKQTKVRFG